MLKEEVEDSRLCVVEQYNYNNHIIIFVYKT